MKHFSLSKKQILAVSLFSLLFIAALIGADFVMKAKAQIIPESVIINIFPDNMFC